MGANRADRQYDHLLDQQVGWKEESEKTDVLLKLIT